MNNSVEMTSKQAFKLAAEDYKDFPLIKDVVAKIESLLEECVKEGIISAFEKHQAGIHNGLTQIFLPLKYVIYGFMRGISEEQELSSIKITPHTDSKNFTLSYEDPNLLKGMAYIAITESSSHYYSVFSDNLDNDGVKYFFDAVKLSLKTASELFGHGGIATPPLLEFRH